MNRKDQVKKLVESTKVIAIIRGMAPAICASLAKAYCEGGIRLVEVTFSQVGNPEDTVTAIRAIKAALPQLCVGAGTVLTAAQLDQAIAAGAEFMVTPSTNPELIRKANAAGLVTIPGALTPTEVVTAHEAGADYVKIFPVRALGQSYIKDILAPLKHIKLLAVGGVTPENAADYLKAGCVGIGANGSLVNKEWIAAGQYDRIAAVARAFTLNCES